MMEVPHAELFHATVDGKPVREIDSFCSRPHSAPLRIQLPHARRRRPGRSRFAPLHGQTRISADGHRGGVKLLAAAVLVAVLVAVAVDAHAGARPRVVQLPAGRRRSAPRDAGAGGTEVRGSRPARCCAPPPISMGAHSWWWTARASRCAEPHLDGNRDRLEQRTGLPPSDKPFSQFTRGNGVLAVGVDRLRIEDVRFRKIAGFAVLVSRSRDVASSAWRWPTAARAMRAAAITPPAASCSKRARAISGDALAVPQHSRQRRLDALAVHLAAQRERLDRFQ
jgi:hypothetical protein